jgi:nucleoside-diphosphate-sugar epimerase
MISMKVFVTGGRGFIGQLLVQALVDQGIEVFALTRKNIKSDKSGLHFIHGDLTQPADSYEKYLKDCNIIFNCAGEINDPSRMRGLHVDGTRLLLMTANIVAEGRGAPIHFVQLSSVGAYGPPQVPTLKRKIIESTPENPIGEYEITKTEADHLVMDYCNGKNMTFSILRPSNVFGPTMTNNSVRNLIKLIDKKLFFYIGEKGAISTYVHVDDVVKALIQCGLANAAKGQIFNISNDCPLEDLVNGIAKALNIRPPRLRLPESLVRLSTIAFSKVPHFPLTKGRVNALVNRTEYPCDKINEILGYRPQKYVPEAISEMIKA